MRAVIQRVKEAKVSVDKKVVASIGKGILVFLAVHKSDIPTRTLWLAQKILHLRLFADEKEKMNLSIQQVSGDILVVSQFTLYGSCLEGRRPDFTEAASPSMARELYEKFTGEMKRSHPKVETGIFGAEMEVHLINDGPVTFILDTPISS